MTERRVSHKEFYDTIGPLDAISEGSMDKEHRIVARSSHKLLGKIIWNKMPSPNHYYLYS